MLDEQVINFCYQIQIIDNVFSLKKERAKAISFELFCFWDTFLELLLLKIENKNLTHLATM